jgi:hypothetical protein
VSHEARSRERRKRSYLGFGFLFLGVLLCGCSRDTSVAARIPLPARPAPVTARLGTHIPSLSGAERVVYKARIEPDLKRIDVELCPAGFRIERLNAPSPGAERLLERGTIITPQGEYPCPAEGVDLPLTRPDDCVRYSVNLPEKSSDPTSLQRIGSDALLSPDLWLWIPTPRPVGVQMQLQLALPDGLVALLPFQDTIPENVFAWKSAGAFGHSSADALLVDGAELSVATLGDGFGARTDAVRDWLARGARATSTLFGHFPVPRALVITVPDDRKGPGFGMALRGGGPAVVIFLDRHATSLDTDWTATHEFLHLGVPRLPLEDAWLFEGLATYYTEVVRARAGMISPKQAYQHLLEGFERGRIGGTGVTLRDESSQMHERHSFHRVYWAGAALAFLTDVEARRASGPTLDSALRAFAECCASSEDEWNAERVLARLDQNLGAPRFTEHARRWLDRAEFPEIEATLRTLGVAAGPRGEAIFGRAPNAAIRDAIMAKTWAKEATASNRSPTESQSQPHRPE